jgi:hypothetical protein
MGMKIRNGFVSNSSSSSFVIVPKDRSKLDTKLLDKLSDKIDSIRNGDLSGDTYITSKDDMGIFWGSVSQHDTFALAVFEWAGEHGFDVFKECD